ncbi:DUF6371 domain-containing protein [Polaribacter dokdonensis]|uniref:Uncharacterized protein n=2 Tax=Polaribacter dokdonensis DSW-5 TaxID=1300348 RepID=A0A0M9CGM4_9FLAO|nr:DUF6371 domain-containing protein [Polaribacter dokdonensis]KOY52241.1 hypothetical protein I602_1801 [Polaribacter dokdonensis DSW-5]
MSKNYKYSLDPSSKKFLCPNCNKKTFVKFIDNETMQYLNHIDGRCDRESKCGYFKNPSKNCIVNNASINHVATQPTFHKTTVLQQFSSINQQDNNSRQQINIVNNGINNIKQQNNFITYLLKHYDPTKVLQAINKFQLGTTNYWNGATVFWQIDSQNVIHGGKIMLYDRNTGKRVKKPYNRISWIHKQMKLKDFVLQQCLFGLQNINNIEKGNTICLVESEKTAVIMSIVEPKVLWLATGSKSNFQKELLNPLKEYNVIAYPDKTEFDKWNKVSKQLNLEGFHIQCSTILETSNIEDGGDLVDLINSEQY